MAFNFKDFTKGVSNLRDALEGSQKIQDYARDGFLVSSPPTADGTGLPSNKVTPYREGRRVRQMIHWFIPEFGIVKMYINPQSIVYENKKMINTTRTKGGYDIQYWGEDFTTLRISGTTGSSGVEGINVLYEAYRAEQYALDSVNLTLAAQSTAYDLASTAVSKIGGAVGGALGGLAGNSGVGSVIGSEVLGGLAGTNSSAADRLANRELPSLASIAFGVEMYYAGWVYRGYFNDFNFTESATDFLWTYNIGFTVTQHRGYRYNYFPWHRSANNGESRQGLEVYSYNPKYKEEDSTQVIGNDEVLFDDE